ncbi:hypothetical protein M0R45_021666 [Rubus argutus]|uniref:Uncharacterized protein n=1 Tax=Rubus argutus TaxID=59490 RepID=A0AAW1XED5_RUBAR
MATTAIPWQSPPPRAILYTPNSGHPRSIILNHRPPESYNPNSKPLIHHHSSAMTPAPPPPSLSHDCPNFKPAPDAVSPFHHSISCSAVPNGLHRRCRSNHQSPDDTATNPDTHHGSTIP